MRKCNNVTEFPASRCLKSKQGEYDYRSMTKLKPYHRFLLRNRIYCSQPGCLDTLNKATQVVKVNGVDEVFCDKHAGRLADVRKSDQLQDLVKQETKTPNQTA